jgi:hypothetical protein
MVLEHCRTKASSMDPIQGGASPSTHLTTHDLLTHVFPVIPFQMHARHALWHQHVCDLSTSFSTSRISSDHDFPLAAEVQ